MRDGYRKFNEPETKRDHSYLNEDDEHAWKDAFHLYREGFLGVISPQIPHIPAWASQLYGQATGNECLPTEEIDFSYRINFADMQRLYLRKLQANLIDFAVIQRFDPDKAVSKASFFESTLKEYGGFSP